MPRLLHIIGLLGFCLFPLCYQAFAQQNNDEEKQNPVPREEIMASGRVLDALTGHALPGISISVDNFSAAISDSLGQFEIKVPNTNALLKVEGEGFQQKLHALNRQTEDIEIQLFESHYDNRFETAKLPGGNRITYKITKATRTLNLENDQWGNPVNTSPGDFIQGRIAGLNSVRKSGSPGAGAYLTIRGFNSLYATNKPLIVVDGMVYDDEDYGSGILQYQSSSPLTNIDLKDIEDITVIKDGSSLYGTKGANGVIAITTNRPTDVSTKIDFTAYGSYNQSPEELPLLNAGQFRTYLSQLLATQPGFSQDGLAGQPFMANNPQDPDYYTYHNNTNWQKEVFKNSWNQNYYLKVRGGDDIAKYGLSVGYLNNRDVIENTGLKRYSTRLNADLKLTPKLSILANLSFIYNEANQRNQGFAYRTNPLYLALTKAPFLAVNNIDSEGEVSPNLADTDAFNTGNPRAIIDNAIGVNKNYRFFGNLDFSYTFNDTWKLHGIFGLTFNKERENFFIPDHGVADIVLPLAIATNRSGSEVQRLFSIYTDTYLDFSRAFDHKHYIDARIGLRTQSNETESDLGLGYNSATDDFTSVGSGTNLLRKVGGELGDWNWVNAYLGARYNYLHKYYVSANVAVDGSSRFGSDADKGLNIGDNSFAVLPSLSAGWILSNEPFLSGSKTLNYLKLRGTFGLTGNDDIGNYTAKQYYVSQNLLGLQGLVRGNIGNPRLKWETVVKTNLGADLSLFGERLNISADVFHNNTRDMITYESVPGATGFDYIVSNSGAMKTGGFDLDIRGRVLKHQLKWDVGLVLSAYKNEVSEIPGKEIITEYGGATYITREGQDANLFFGYRTNGVYATTAQAESDGLQKRMANGELLPFRGGDVIFTDLNGDRVIDDNDRAVIGNPNPDFTGAFTTTLNYGRFTLDALLNFSVGNDLYNGLRYNLEKMSGYENQTAAIQNRWVAEGQKTDIPRAGWGDPMGNASFSDRWIEDGSYLRLKTIVLTYDVRIRNTDYLKYLKVYLTGNNLLTFTDYLGFDPEFSTTSSIFGQGVDMGLVPQYRTVQLGVRLGL